MSLAGGRLSIIAAFHRGAATASYIVYTLLCGDNGGYLLQSYTHRSLLWLAQHAASTGEKNISYFVEFLNNNHYPDLNAIGNAKTDVYRSVVNVPVKSQQLGL